MASNWVMKLPQDKIIDSPFLVQVNGKDENILDLDLLATDGDVAFRGKVRQRNLSKLKSKNYDGSDDELANILQYFLRPTTHSDVDATQQQNLDIGCAVSGKDPKATLTITIRNKIEDITQRIATIELPQTSDTDDVDLFGWAGQAIDQRDQLDQEVMQHKRDIELSKITISKLEEQLAEFVKLKKEHETQLLTKFALLLNEKKLKIRNMQRVLASAKIDSDKLTDLQIPIKSEALDLDYSKGKRNADEMSIDEGEESEGFEGMDVDGADAKNNRDVTPVDSVASSRHTTPRNSDGEETETDEEELSSTKPRTGPEPSRTQPARAVKETSPMPPRRDLPFGEKGNNTAATSAGGSRSQAGKEAGTKKNVAVPADESTESEDDEL